MTWIFQSRQSTFNQINTNCSVLVKVKKSMEIKGESYKVLALATKPPNDELMKRTPVGRQGNFISNVMWRNILGQSLYQFMVIWFLRVNGKALFCQIFNEICFRDVEEIDVFKGILDNYVFVTFISIILVFQVIIVEYLGTFANTTPLSFMQWFLSIFVIGFLGMLVAVDLQKVPV